MRSERAKYSSSPILGVKSKNLWKKLGLYSDRVDQVPDYEAIPEPSNAFAPDSMNENPQGYSEIPNSYVPYAQSAQGYPQYGYQMQDSVPDYGQGSYAPMQQAFYAPQQSYGTGLPGNGYPNQGYVTQQGYTVQQSYAVPQQGYAANYGTAQPPYAAAQQGYAIPQQEAQPLQRDEAPAEEQDFASSRKAKPEKPARDLDTAPKAPLRREPMQKGKLTTGQLLSIFMFGALPVLLVISYFHSAVFYSYITLAVACGIIMWYREIYASVLRMIVTGILILTCAYGVIQIVRIPKYTTINSTGAETVINNPIIIQVQETASVQASDAVSVTPTPEPESIQSDAEKRLSAFMDLWKTNNASAMVAYVQPSWVNKQTSAEEALFKLLANRTALSYTIESVSGTETDSSRTVTMTAVIDKNNNKSTVTYRFMVMMVKEGDEWYVNPNSLATNDEVEDTETVVVNDSKSSVTMTEVPRTTVTPVPSGDTVLYYNPDGGSYYHRDANCSSIKSEYLPLKGSFYYSELAYYKNTLGLSPCIKCSAPVNTMPPSE